jgi:adenine-specific DNA-methyltransferase
MEFLDTLTTKTKPTIKPEPKSGEYVANYIGSKQNLLDWTWDETPNEIDSVFDAFSGAATLSYMYKSKGLRIVSNDRLHYCYHIARAIIENNYTYLDDDDIELLFQPNPNSGTFVRDTFKGLYFGKGVHSLIDQFRANCDYLYGYKKDIALFALGATCISSTCGFGNFTTTSTTNKPLCLPKEFKERFRTNLQKVNNLVFDNGKQNKAVMMNVFDVMPFVQTDMIFFDTPYATEYSVTNYEKSYHFVEELMTYWEGLTIKTETKLKCYEIDHETITKNNVYDFFTDLFERAGHYPYWIISYRDHAYPTEKEMKDIITSFGRTCNVVSNYYKYTIAGKRTPASISIEYLFICKTRGQALLDLPTYAPMNRVLQRPDRFLKRTR